MVVVVRLEGINEAGGSRSHHARTVCPKECGMLLPQTENSGGGGFALQAGRLLLSLGDLDGAAALFAKAEASPQVHTELPFDQSTASSFIDRSVDKSPASAELSSTTCRPPGSVMPPT